jgi:hypothetical protein
MLLFHGTSKRQWSRRLSGEQTLYLVNSAKEAWSYAYHAAEEDELEGRTPEPIVLAIQLGDLRGLTRLPDDAAIRSGELPASASWRDTLRAVGSFAVFGRIERYKRFFARVRPATSLRE